MATTFIDYTGDGNATKQFTFPSIQESDVKVDVDGVVKSSGTHYNITGYTTTGGGNVVFTSGNIPVSPQLIRIFRDTDVDSAKATYTAGSSVKAADLNANHEQLLFAAQEEQNQTIQTQDIKDGAITSAKILDGTISSADLGSDSVITAKIADNAVTMAKLAGGTLPTDITVASTNIVDLSVATADLANGAVTTPKLGADAVDGTKIADDAVDSEHIAADSLDTEHYAPTSIDSAALASNSVTSSKITDANVTTAKIANDAITIGKIGCEQTTITDSDSHLPTSGAVVDYVAAQLEPFGGFEAIANELSFPNTQPVSGVAISIADAAGLVVNSSGVSTTGRTVGGTTVTINNIPSNFHSSTIATGIRFIVTSTGSSQTYNYHKATLPESDLVSLSGDINDFNERYRVGSTNPSTNNDAGDLFFNTSTGKLLVYNGTTGAWEVTQSVGNFFINTISSSSGTGGGSATFNGSAYRFTLSNAGSFAQQHIVSINGVVQKPNSGSSQPSEGFAVSGADIIFSAAPASGADFFIITLGSTVSIGTPSDGTVNADKITSGAVTTAKIADGNVTTAKIADESITLAKFEHGTSSNNGKFLRANNGADPTFETINNQTVQFPSGAVGVSCSTENEIQINSANYKVVFDTDTSNIHEISFAGPSSLSKTSAYTLPEDGSNGQFLKTNGSGVLSFDTIDLTALSASNLTSGTIPDARFPSTLPALDGSNLTGLASTVADDCVYENSQTISNNYTVGTNKNAFSAGPITIANGATVTVPSGSTYTII